MPNTISSVPPAFLMIFSLLLKDFTKLPLLSFTKFIIARMSSIGTNVPIAKTIGNIKPIEDLRLNGMTIPKNNQNKVGQNAKEKNIPIVKEGFNIFNFVELL